MIRTRVIRLVAALAGLAAIGLGAAALPNSVPTATADIISFNKALRVSDDSHYTHSTYTLTGLVVQPGYSALFFDQVSGSSGTRQLIATGYGTGDFPEATASAQWTPTVPGIHTISLIVRGGSYQSEVASVVVEVLPGSTYTPSPTTTEPPTTTPSPTTTIKPEPTPPTTTTPPCNPWNCPPTSPTSPPSTCTPWSCPAPTTTATPPTTTIKPEPTPPTETTKPCQPWAC
ncbi:hypothetical protein [Nocardia sp. XZ_19_385]|uniref:hypothetical protein n=1 Tax=Nocardia sp. XZ_19_385 TaxID=2769488 RepID=UPI001890003C|nr:hypothetical protein [Nocardia sp. XZ_19_385]